MKIKNFIRWISNAIYFYRQRILNSQRDSKIWAFGAWEGNKYSDNSKYFYEYVKENHKEIRCMWFTANPDIFNSLKQRGDRIYLIGSEKSKIMQTKAGVSFYTNGVDDFGDSPYIYGSVIVSLWHGVSFKKIYGDDEVHHRNKFLKSLKNQIFSFAFRDITITTSKYMKNKAISQFYIKNINSIYVTGQPRNDVFKNKIYASEIVNDSRLIGKKIITYMPTYQSFNNQQELVDIIRYLDENEDFNKFLVKYDYILVLKLHYLAKANDMKLKNIVLLKDEMIADVQQLLAATDILITDYSSVFADFALTDRPIIFFRPNDATYLDKAGLYDEFKTVCDLNKVITREKLFKVLKSIISGSYDYHPQNTIINEYFADPDINKESYCENVYKIVKCEIDKRRSV